MYSLCVFLVLTCTVLVESAPGSYVGGAAAIREDIPNLFTFDNGNVGLNFLGFKASAGLGGLLTGKTAAGSLHAEAGTPFGQSARAGLGGNLDGQGKSVGGIYADATAGGEVGAGAGLAGTAEKEVSHGISYAGTSAGEAYKEKTIITSVVPVEDEVAPFKVVNKHVELKPQKTYIERTVIPNYEEKTIYVPSYVEKTVRVPTVIEKKVKVPAPPTIIEKSVNAPAEVNFETSKIHLVDHAPIATSVIHNHRIHSRPFFKEHFFVGGGYGGGYGAGYTSQGSGESYNRERISGTKTFAIQKNANSHLVEDIFSIPVSTLGAVSKLVGGLAAGASGSLSVAKSVSIN